MNGQNKKLLSIEIVDYTIKRARIRKFARRLLCK